MNSVNLILLIVFSLTFVNICFTCTDVIQCVAVNVYTEDSRSCPQGSTFNSDSLECIVNVNCKSHSTCNGTSGEFCVQGICQVIKGLAGDPCYYLNYSTDPKIDTCKYGLQCSDLNAKCIRDVNLECVSEQCPFGQSCDANGDCVASPSVGEECVEAEEPLQCETGSFCHRNSTASKNYCYKSFSTANGGECSNTIQPYGYQCNINEKEWCFLGNCEKYSDYNQITNCGMGTECYSEGFYEVCQCNSTGEGNCEPLLQFTPSCAIAVKNMDDCIIDNQCKGYESICALSKCATQYCNYGKECHLSPVAKCNNPYCPNESVLDPDNSSSQSTTSSSDISIGNSLSASTISHILLSLLILITRFLE
ncbi:disintegrin-like protein [Tieghemostelium lacteum]|uniref:Disintegrin-like protein n=1 Tax=Tieghemostelium lacteum TaxID=361077 RepID=A0A152A0M5_TIELA|nr:disintegrin-like protein [Tieghemostelium lacteum]|eukprot:KYQ99666.1 disintegrin-like protein [Tieghemostelium lacteum]